MFPAITNKLKTIACLLSIFGLTFIASAHRQDSRVTEVFLKADNPQMSGPCPLKVVFNGSITANGPGTVKYTFERSDGARGPAYAMEFKEAGTQAVTTDWTLGDASTLPRYDGWQSLKILSPNEMESSHETGSFSVTCGQPQPVDRPPVIPIHGRFRVTLNGFRVNHQTNQGLWAAWDAVTFHPNISMVDASGQARHYFQGSGPTSTIGSSPEHSVQGGSASPRGGLQTGDGFPTQTTPWRRTVPYTVQYTIPPTLYFEQELVQNTNAGVIIPTIWEVDGRSDLDLVGAYASQLNHDFPALGRAVARIIRGPQPLTLDSYLRPGNSMGLRSAIRLAIGVPQNRPIGMQPEQDIRGFTPQVLVLTYDSAEFMSHTDFGLGLGIVSVRYVDHQAFAGDYTLYFQVERVNN